MLRYEDRNNPAEYITSVNNEFRGSKEMIKTDTKKGRLSTYFTRVEVQVFMQHRLLQSTHTVKLRFSSLQEEIGRSKSLLEE